jgi:hypothetical protein
VIDAPREKNREKKKKKKVIPNPETQKPQREIGIEIKTKH